MQDLQLVGVHDDGEHLLLTTADGHRFRLGIDEPLRAAVRRDRARLGQLQIQIDGTLRPRDIQARIRAGQTAEDVALAAGVPVEHVRRYEGPVLAEREHVVGLAQRQAVRGHGSARGPQLVELVAERLAARGADGGSWDAWRRDDGAWTVQLSFQAGSKDRRARWTYDLVARTLEPTDDESRWLTSSDDGHDGPIPGRRLAAVKERVYDVEADGGVREARRTGAKRGGTKPADEAPEESAATPNGQTVDLLEELRGRRGRRQPVLTPEELAAEDDEADAVAAADPPAAHPPASRPDEAVDAEILALPEQAVGGSADEPEAGDGPEPEGEPVTTGSRRQAKAKSRRASVPSWDEIVFGAKKD
jgi:hypothetical protein